MNFLVQDTVALQGNNNGIAVGVGVRAANVDGGENLAIDGNMEFLAGRNAEVDVGGAHAAGGKKKKSNKRRKNLKRKFHTLFVQELSMTEVTQDTIFNPLTSSLRVKPPQEDAPYVFGSAPVVVWVGTDVCTGRDSPGGGPVARHVVRPGAFHVDGYPGYQI
jgi:hypothetical protein